MKIHAIIRARRQVDGIPAGFDSFLSPRLPLRCAPAGQSWAAGGSSIRPYGQTGEAAVSAGAARNARNEKQIKFVHHPGHPPHGPCGSGVFRLPEKDAGTTGLSAQGRPIRTTSVITKGRPERAALSSKRLFF